MDRAELLPVIPGLNKASLARPRVDSRLKANAFVYTATRLCIRLVWEPG